MRNSESNGQLIEGGTTTKITVVDGVAVTERAEGGLLYEESVAKVDIRLIGVSDFNRASALDVRAAHPPRGEILHLDGVVC